MQETISHIASPQDILKRVFGFDGFRSSQEQIINDVLMGRDTMVIMATGGGKSLCYQIPALCLPHLTIVVSPLIALMKDQVTALQNYGVHTAFYNSTLTSNDKSALTTQLRNGELKLLYAAPESLFSIGFETLLNEIKISLFAIDEAHCISVWGNDFRPEYTKLERLKKQFPAVPLIALTATADQATQTDIVKQLGIESAGTYIESFERPNIIMSAKSGHNRFEEIDKFLRPLKGESGIIYCLSRKNTERLSEKLNHIGHRSSYYHAGMEAHVRSDIQRKFQNDEIDIICATIAFGMGIDKANVRFVIHYNMPKNIEGFYQEIGRSGRDGLTSQSLLFASWADMMRLRTFIEESGSNESFKTVQMAKLERMWEFSNATSCRTNFILNYFGEYKTSPCGHCDNCLHPPEVFDGTVLAQKALSAVSRCNQNAGLNMLIDVLRGSSKQEVAAAGYNRVKTFGAGRDLPFLDWKAYITQMINLGILKIDYTDRSRLKITPLSNPVLRGQQKIDLVRFKAEVPVPKKKSKTALIEDELFQKLKEWRINLARQSNIPAYTILSDNTLRELAEKKPFVLAGLLEISGIGQVKYEKYGNDLVNIIREYLRTQEHRKNIKGKTYLQTHHLYKQGLTPQEIAAMRNLNVQTICSHLAMLYEQGEDIDIDRLVTPSEMQLIHDKWLALKKPEDLKTTFDALGGKYEYYKVRIVVHAKK